MVDREPVSAANRYDEVSAMGEERWQIDGAFGGDLAVVDPTLGLVTRFEEDRQARKLIMIASESICPPSVREALGSAFTSIYAEGYPAWRMHGVAESHLADLSLQLAHHRRYGDRRYYKGTDYVNVVESLARRRVAELFATSGDVSARVRVTPEEIHANVQALSGAAANNAVYAALIQPGDTIMGLDLTHGGHLTHGSPVNRSGRYYKVASYGVDHATGRIDYDALEATAREARPRLIVAGASAYPWDIDWARLRRIADSLDEPARILADISHPAGLVVAGLFPNPIGYADAVTFTTHKTLLGPRAAVILSTSPDVARRIDSAVFPGEQGGPHVNNIAAMAVSFGIAQTPAFRDVQRRIVENARALADGLVARGLRLAYGGTNTHLLLVDLKSVGTGSGVALNGDLASRVLDVAGIVCNKNTISGDTSAHYPSGLRFGTTWLTQRGFGPAEMDRIAGTIGDVLSGIRTFAYTSNGNPIPRGRIASEALNAARREVASLTKTDGADASPASDPTAGSTPADLLIRGARAASFLQTVASANVLALSVGGAASSLASVAADAPLSVVIARLADAADGSPRFVVRCPAISATRFSAWLGDLSDGYVMIDDDDLLAKVDGPVAIEDASAVEVATVAAALREAGGLDPEIHGSKPYFIGQAGIVSATAPKPSFEYEAPADAPLRRTPLYDEHVRLGARIVPFGGYEMPIWYSSIGEEHQTVRQAAGLFDLAHMGVLEVSGPDACRFLDVVTTNYVTALEIGKAQYSYVLDADGGVLDDILIYRRGADRYMLVVNASNADKVAAWLTAVRDRSVAIDRELPQREVDASPLIRDLRADSAGDEGRVDLAVQGPDSLDVLLDAIGEDADLARRVTGLGRFEFVEGAIGGVPALIARTGYTGEKVGYEVYVPPARAVEVWRRLLAAGAAHGLRPIGLGARDSLRTEAGFPLYGHELAGDEDISPIGAGYGGFVKFHKPFFIGRAALRQIEEKRTRAVVRFRMDGRGGRMARSGDPVLNRRGECIGRVTSCTAIEGVQLGLAYVDRAASQPGTPIAIFPLSSVARGRPEKAKTELVPGDRVLLHEPATVLPRFM